MMLVFAALRAPVMKTGRAAQRRPFDHQKARARQAGLWWAPRKYVVVSAVVVRSNCET